MTLREAQKQADALPQEVVAALALTILDPLRAGYAGSVITEDGRVLFGKYGGDLATRLADTRRQFELVLLGRRS